MKKVTCLCIYTDTNKGYLIKSINVKYKHNNISLFKNNDIYFPTFNNMYKIVLNLLGKNNFYVHTWEEFNAKWYDIDFLNAEGSTVNRYPFKKI